MLKISDFAKLAHTTRRTLIFYDKKGLFKPIKTDNKGYRFYEANQLYQFQVISGLRQLGLSLDEIAHILSEQNDEEMDTYLEKYQEKLQEQMRHLEVVNQLLETKRSYRSTYESLEPYQLTILSELEQEFWCTDLEVDCQPDDIARLYAQFMEDLGELQSMVTSQTGFLTDLALEKGEAYPTAAFRFIKAKTILGSKSLMTRLDKPAGSYLTVKVENTSDGILKGLSLMNSYAQQEKLETANRLWQLNVSEDIINNASSKYGVLQYQILSV